MFLSSSFPAWGRSTVFRLGTTPPETYPVEYTPNGAICRLEFGRELVCELRPHGPELEGNWRFGLHQLLDVPAGAGQVLVMVNALTLTLEPAG